MVTCQEIQADPGKYVGQSVTLSGSVQTKQVLPQGIWLLLSDGTGYAWVWSSGKLDGDYSLSGTVYESYLILDSATPLQKIPAVAEVHAQAETTEAYVGPSARSATKFPQVQAQPATAQESAPRNRLLKPLVVSTSSIAYGFGLYSLTLSYPPAAKSGIFYLLPVLALILGFASWFVLKNLDMINKRLGIAVTGGRVENMWKLYPPLIVSAFAALYLSPEVIAESATPGFSAEIRRVFFISLAPVAISFVIQFLNAKKYSQDAKSRLAISLISVAIIVVPLLMLYPILSGTLG